MFRGPKRNLNLSGAKDRSNQAGVAHGINWGVDQTGPIKSNEDYTDDYETESRWVDEDLQPFFVPNNNINQQKAIRQSEQTVSAKQNAEIAVSRQSDSSYPALQKRPDFYEQHKKVTVYLPKEQLETIEKLKKGRYIPSYSWLVAEAIQFYLQNQLNHS